MAQRQILTREAGHQLLDTLDPDDVYASAAAGRTALGLGTAATHATGDYDAAGAAAAAAAASQPLDSDLTAIAALSTTSYGRALLALADAAAGRTAFGLGTAAVAASGDFQPIDTDLTAIAALTTTSYGRSLLEAANAAALRTLAGLVIGTDVRAQGSGDPTRASLGLATSDSPQFAGVNVGDAADTTITRTGAGDIAVEGNGIYRAGGTDVAVADGGTGAGTAATARTNLGVVNDPWTEIRAASDEDVTNAGLTDHSTLLFAATSGVVYNVQLLMVYSGNDVTGDFRFNYTLPTGTNGLHRLVGDNTTGDVINLSTGIRFAGVAALPSDVQAGVDASFGKRIMWHEMFIVAGASSNVRLRFGNGSAGTGRTSRVCTGTVLRYRALS